MALQRNRHNFPLAMARQVTVLGSQAAYPTHGQPCSGFLVRWDALFIVLDLGYGTLDPLLAHVPNGQVAAVVITHDHPDHWIDLHGLFRLLYYGGNSAKVSLFCPAGVVDKMVHLETEIDLCRVFDVCVIGDGAEFTVGPLSFTALQLPHFVPNMGIRMDIVQNEKRKALLAYTGDTGPCARLAELGKDVGLYIIEATDRAGEEEKQQRNLLTSAEAGFWAGEAAAKRVLLTHFWPGNDRELAVKKAKFAGEILGAEPGMSVNLEYNEQ